MASAKFLIGTCVLYYSENRTFMKVMKFRWDFSMFQGSWETESGERAGMYGQQACVDGAGKKFPIKNAGKLFFQHSEQLKEKNFFDDFFPLVPPFGKVKKEIAVNRLIGKKSCERLADLDEQ